MAPEAAPTTDVTELRKVFNDMNVRNAARGEGMVAFRPDGSVLEWKDMTPVQRKAFDMMVEVSKPQKRRGYPNIDEDARAALAEANKQAIGLK